MKNEAKIQTIVLLATLVFFLVTMGFICYGVITPKMRINAERVQITGLYGDKINISDITEVKLVNQIPKVLARTNGLGPGYPRKGYFTLEDFGTTKLFLESGKPPFLIIERQEGEKIILNYKEKGLTEKYYSELIDVMR